MTPPDILSHSWTAFVEKFGGVTWRLAPDAETEREHFQRHFEAGRTPSETGKIWLELPWKLTYPPENWWLEDEFSF